MRKEALQSKDAPALPERNSIGPGAKVGILGGGQLGRMFGIAARRMGYRVHAFEPNPDSPAGQISDVEVNAPFSDEAALAAFAADVDVVSFEFENIPLSAIEEVARCTPVRPRGEVLHICQNREREKAFLRANGFPHAPFAVVESAVDLAAALAEIGTPSVLKTADFGYDGKGQVKLQGDVDTAAVWEKFGSRGVLEKWIPFQAELSVVVARGTDGVAMAFPASENIHKHHILDLSIVPARFDSGVVTEAGRIAERIAVALDVVGLLAVEFFLTKDGMLLVNELAPRPHNSGHYTFDACTTSQFEQQLRAVCGLPLGAPDLLTPVVMWNLLGHLWKDGEPDWSVILSEPRAKLHLYGKASARPGRKMGHVCVLAPVEEALEIIAGFKAKMGD
jgi:5-(carboxyamino)imidazole ribonucleotide synthase